MCRRIRILQVLIHRQAALGSQGRRPVLGAQGVLDLIQVVLIEFGGFGERRIRIDDAVEKTDQHGVIVFCAKQGFKHTIDLGIDVVFHGVCLRAKIRT